MPTSLPPTSLQTKVLIQQADTKGGGSRVHWSPMGREDGVIYEITKTKEMFLAWIYRGLVALILAIGGIAVSLGAYDLTDMRNKIEAVPAIIKIVNDAQHETDADVKVLTQMIKDRTALRDVQFDQFKAKQEAHDRELADHEHRIQGLERNGSK